MARVYQRIYYGKKGEGKIGESKDWWVEYYFSGQRRREKIGPSKKLAEMVLKKRLVEIAEGKHLDVKRTPQISFDEMANKFLEWSKVNKAPHSWESNFYSVRRLKEYFQAKNIIKLAAITPFHVEGYKKMRSEQVSKRSVDIDLVCLRHLLSKAIEWGYTADNAAKKVRLFNPANERLRYLSEDEIVRLIESCDEYFKPVMVVMLHLGLRKAEALGLRWENIDLVNGLIHVEVTKNKRRRDVPMSETVKRELAKLKKNAKSEWVFTSLHDKEKPLRDVRKPFKNACKRAGILNFRLHDCRHTAASHLVMKGVDLRTVQDILGHRDLRMVLRYSHLSPLHREKAVKVMDTIGHHLDTRDQLGEVIEYRKL